MSELKVMQFNCRGIKQKIHDLEYFVNVNNIDIVCLNETKLRNSHVLQFENFNLACFCDSATSTQGSAILVRKTIPVNKVEKPIALRNEDRRILELLRVNISLKNGKTVWITCVYNSPLLEIQKNLIFDDSFYPCIIVGDFNSPHENLCCTSNTVNGEIICEVLESNEISLLNDGRSTHSSQTSSNMLDLHFTNSMDVLSTFKHFLIDENFSSDHKVTISTFSLEKEQVFNVFGRINFDHFRATIVKNLKTNPTLWPPNYPNAGEIETHSRALVSLIKQAVEVSSAQKKGPALRVSRETRNLLLEKKSTRRAISICTSLQERTQLKKHLNYIHRALKKSLINDENEKQYRIIDNAKHGNGRKFWTAVKKLTSEPKKKSMKSISYLDRKSNCDTEAAEIFAKLLKDSMRTKIDTTYIEQQETAEIEDNAKHKLQKQCETCDDERFLTREQLEHILHDTNATSPGPDRLTYKVLSNLPMQLKSVLCLIINASIQYNVVPSTWKETEVIMIPKPQKDTSLASNYRPISLTNCIAKIAETVVKNQLLNACEKNKLFGEAQSAYRRKRCTTDNLIQLTQKISEAFQWSECVGAVFLDVEKAFDAVWRLGLINKLYNLEIDSNIIKWVNSYLSQRKLRVRVNICKSEEFETEAGVPQGSVIAPILFIIYVSQVPEMKATVSQFADDFAIYYRSKSPLLAERNLQNSLNTLTQWCRKLKILINPNKSMQMLFQSTRSHKYRKEMKLNLDDVPIKNVTHAKFLGITLSKDLLWNAHFSELKKRTSIRILQLARLRYMGISTKNLLTMYKGFIRPLLTYANAAWINCSQTIKKSMQVLQNKALRICLSKPLYTPIDELHTLSNIPFLYDFQLRLAKRYLENARLNKICSITTLIETKRMRPKKNFITPLDILFEE